MATSSRDPKHQKKLARKIEEYRAHDGTFVKVYVKKASDATDPNGPLIFYFRCAIGDAWVTYVVIITEGLHAVLGAKGTHEDSIVNIALKYVKTEISRGNHVDGTELEFGPLQEGLFPGR